MKGCFKRIFRKSNWEFELAIIEVLVNQAYFGNIDESIMNVNVNMFVTLPDIFHESALIDRFHGFIKGWEIPKMRKI